MNKTNVHFFRSEIPGFVLTQFQETIKMSTFILAFAVTENYVGYTENNNNFTVYASVIQFSIISCN